jgi:DNA mismatch repair protein MutH
MDDIQAVLSRAEEVRGIAFAEIAKSHGIQWSDYPASRKALPGLVRQAVFGDVKKPWASKSIPLDQEGRVQEHMKLQNLNPGHVRTQTWLQSSVRSKLASILFVPIVKPSKQLPTDWYFERPFVWRPDQAIEAQLEADYESVRGLVVANRPQEISTHAPPRGQGVYLIANTAGRDSEDLIDWGPEGRPIQERRRAWMLRKRFIQSLIDSNLTP